MTNKRLPPDVRGAQLLDVAIALATKHGLANITRDQIAETAGVAQGLVSLRLGTMDKMRRAVMRNAVSREILPIIAEGLASRDRFAMGAPEALRKRAAASIGRA